MAGFDTKYLWIVLSILVVGLLIFGDKLGFGKELQPGAVLNVKMSIVEPNTQSVIVTSSVKTKVDVTTVPFKLTVINGGQIPFTNLRIDAGTIPTVLATAFAGKSIATLAPGTSGDLIADVDVSSLAPASGSQVINFQAKIIADYMVAGNTFTKTGYTSVLPITVMPGAGIAVTVTYE